LQNSRQRSDGIASPGEVVSCRVVKQFGADTVEVAARVRQALDDLRPTIFGPDLDRLARLAAEAREILEGAPGITDLRAEQLTGLPQICVTVDRPSAAWAGLQPGEVIEAVRVDLAGEELSQIWVGQRRFDLVVRLQEEERRDASALRALLVDVPSGARIPSSPASRRRWGRRPSSARPAAGGSPSRRASPGATSEARRPRSANA
jgi:Cu/Ag efflux pump CusA